MNSFTAIALENLIEPRVRDTYKSPFGFQKFQTTKPQQAYYSNKSIANGGAYYGARREEVDDSKPPSANHVYISPALYITPAPAPIPELSSSPLSPSPYVVNHKRRGGERHVNGKIDGFQVPEVRGCGEEEKTGIDLNYHGENEQEKEDLVKDKIGGHTEVDGDGIEEFEGAGEEFFDPAFDMLSVGSPHEVRGFGCSSMSVQSLQWEFFDADEEWFTEEPASNVSFHDTNIASELHSLRLELLEETKKRKAAEDGLIVMRSQWLKIRDILSQEGLTFPSPSDVISGMELEHGSIEQLTQELAVTRFVAKAIGKGQARAEAELASQAILETKNQEISRLKDRLQYYEAVNHEMSLRNQEIIDAAGKQRQRKRTQQKWLWSFIGFSAAIGVSMAAYTYLPQASTHQPPSSDTDSSSS
nr:Dual specificity protein kinase [Ipomoea batatas]